MKTEDLVQDFAPAASPEASQRPIQKMNSTLSAPSAPAFTVVGDAPTLIDRQAPQYIRKSEKPHYRRMLELSAKGYNNKEIAALCGVTNTVVNDILRQPFYQQDLVNEVRKATSQDERVCEVVRESVIEAVTLYRDTVRDKNAKLSDRLAAADRLMDRRYGKPNQPINRGTDVDLNSLSDADLAAMLPTSGTSTSK